MKKTKSIQHTYFLFWSYILNYCNILCLTASLLTIDGYRQPGTTLVIIIISMVAQWRCVPFSQVVNLPWNRGSIFYSGPHRLFQPKCVTCAIMLTNKARGRGWVTILHYQSGRSENRFFCTVFICKTDMTWEMNKTGCKSKKSHRTQWKHMKRSFNPQCVCVNVQGANSSEALFFLFN